MSSLIAPGGPFPYYNTFILCVCVQNNSSDTIFVGE